jgi:hypothetical protein
MRLEFEHKPRGDRSGDQLKERKISGENGAVEKTRTSTGCPTATSTLRVYQFRHDRIMTGAGCDRQRACSKSPSPAQVVPRGLSGGIFHTHVAA